MLYVMSNSYNPFYNLALEEYLLKSRKEDFFMLWRAEPTVIIGKHQNLLAEINYAFVRDNKIKLARRLTGGGTVVHDMQNINFTFIVNGIPGKLIDFKKYVTPIVRFLNSMDIHAQIGMKNDIRIGERKVSGNAEHIYKNRVLHHGTLLYNSDLERLKQAIKVKPGKYVDKAVQSNRAEVTNIVNHLVRPLNIEVFMSLMAEFVLGNNNFTRPLFFSEVEQGIINRLAEEKYANEEWIWGYSPRYTFQNSFEFENQQWQVALEVDKGKIENAEIWVDRERNQVLSEILIGKLHRFEDLMRSFLSAIDSKNNGQLDEIIYEFF
jgi:lipoate---protein ligase